MGRKAKSNPLPEGGHWLLPSIGRTFAVLGLPNDIKGLVHFIQNEQSKNGQGQKLPVDVKTLRKGAVMTPDSMLKVWRYLRRTLRFFSVAGSGRTLRDARVAATGSRDTANTVAWRSVIAGLGRAGGWFPTTLVFIEERCDRESELMQTVAALNGQPHVAAECLRQGLRNHTRIPEEHLGVGVDQLIALAHAQASDADTPRVLTEDLVATVLWMWWDPWLQLAAVAEAEWCNANPDSIVCGVPGSAEGIMGQLWPVRDRERLIYPPERLFEYLRRAVSIRFDLGAPMSWRLFAELLPDPDPARYRRHSPDAAALSKDAK